jgi:hypothetical protein
MTIQAIETRYAGHRFRSRLEARWTVFFNALGIKWEYEPQGFLVGHDERPYLPDFYLPRGKLWVEVKGSEDTLDIDLLVAAAVAHSGLPLDPSGTPHPDPSNAGPRLLILGPVPQHRYVNVQPVHSVLSFHKGDVSQTSAWFDADGSVQHEDGPGGLIGSDAPDIRWDTRGTEWGNFTGCGCLIFDDDTRDIAVQRRVGDAYRAARSARFEHGEAGR